MHKNVLYIIFISSIFSFCLTSCKSFDKTIPEQKSYFDDSVMPMKVIINKASVEECHNPVYNKNTTAAEVARFIRQNLMFKSKPNNLNLSVIMRYNKNESNITLGAMLLPFLLVGGPGAYHSFTITLEAAIMNKNSKILKTYTSTAKGTELAGGWGRLVGDDDAEMTALYEALRLACENLRAQLKNDSENINKLAH